MKKITLSNEVMVSDPCYSLPTWCQHKLNSVLPGQYQPFCKIQDTGDWGERNGMLLVVHEDYQFKDLSWKMVTSIGVDSGQAGIFSMETYRNDLHSLLQEKPMGKKWDYGSFNGNDGDNFYDLMCGITINNDEGWGTYDKGVVSCSGYGDGSYFLYVAKERNDFIVGICIDFAVEEDGVVDFDFYKEWVN